MLDFKGFIDRTDDKKLIVITTVFFILLYAVLLIKVLLFDAEPEVDAYVFYDYCVKMHEGLIPYKDFVVEFTPVSLLYFYIPGIFGLEFNTFFTVYSLETIIAAFLTFLIGLKMLPDNKRMKVMYTVVFIIIMIIYGESMVVKLDMMTVAATAFGVYLFTTKRRIAGYGFIMIAALTKIYPVLLLPLFFFIDLLERSDKDRVKNAFSGIAVSVVVGAVAFLPFIILGATISDITVWVNFHSGRGFQVESTVGIVVQFLSDIGIGDCSLIPNNHTFDVVSPITDALLPIWMYILGVILVAIIAVAAVLTFRNGFKDDTERKVFVLVSSTALITAFMLFNKVFSTQYLLWLIPLIMAFPAFGFKPNMKIMYIILIAFFLLSEGRKMDPIPFHSLFMIRDIIMFAIIVFMIRFMTDPERYGYTGSSKETADRSSDSSDR